MLKIITFLRNIISKLYNAASTPVAVTRDALAERLQCVCETASFLYNRMLDNIEYGRERLNMPLFLTILRHMRCVPGQ